LWLDTGLGYMTGTYKSRNRRITVDNISSRQGVKRGEELK
jgi:hypothetical protein